MKPCYIFGAALAGVLLLSSCQEIPNTNEIDFSTDGVYAFPFVGLDSGDPIVEVKSPYDMALAGFSKTYGSGVGTATRDIDYPSADTYEEYSQTVDISNTGGIFSSNSKVEKIQQIDLKSGIFSIGLTYSCPSSVEVVLESNQILDASGNEFSKSLGILTKGNNRTAGADLDFSGYSIRPAADKIIITLKYRVHIKSGDQLSGSVSIKPSVTLKNYELLFMKGVIKQSIIDAPPQSIDFSGEMADLSRKIGTSKEDKEVIMKITNTYGVPIRIDLSKIQFHFGGGNVKLLTGSITDPKSQEAIVREATLEGTKVTPRVTTISLNSGNSNIHELISKGIVSISLSASLIVPASDDSTPPAYHFAYFSGDQKGKAKGAVLLRIPINL